jgi:hypothetical protein
MHIDFFYNRHVLIGMYWTICIEYPANHIPCHVDSAISLRFPLVHGSKLRSKPVVIDKYSNCGHRSNGYCCLVGYTNGVVVDFIQVSRMR